MNLSESLRQKSAATARKLIARLSRFKVAFALSSSGYCAVHWLAVHNFSIYVLASAVVFGVITAMAVARFSSSST
jgi:hypothetical protein